MSRFHRACVTSSRLEVALLGYKEAARVRVGARMDGRDPGCGKDGWK